MLRSVAGKVALLKPAVAGEVARLKQAMAGEVARLKQAVRHSGTGWGRVQPPPVEATTIRSQPPPDPQPPTHSLFASRDYNCSPILHIYRQHQVGDKSNEYENQLSVLKMRLIALRAYTAENAEQIINDPRLDLKSLPLVSHLVSEYIKRYICLLRSLDASETYHQFLIFLVIGDYIELSKSPTKLTKILKDQNAFEKLDTFCVTSAVERYVELCSEYCPSSSEVSKNKLLQMLEMERDVEALSFYYTGLDRAMFRESYVGPQ